MYDRHACGSLHDMNGATRDSPLDGPGCQSQFDSDSMLLGHSWHVHLRAASLRQLLEAASHIDTVAYADVSSNNANNATRIVLDV